MAEPPAGGRDVEEGLGLAVAAGDLERQALPVEVRVRLPVDSPVPRHGHPPGPRSFDRRRLDGAAAADVGDEHQLEVVAPVDGEPHPSLLHTWHPVHIFTNSSNNSSRLIELIGSTTYIHSEFRSCMQLFFLLEIYIYIKYMNLW